MNQKTNSLDKVRQLPAPGRLGLFLCCLLLLWLPLALPILWFFYTEFRQVTEVVLAVWLYGLFVWLIGFWGKHIEQKEFPYRYYGLWGGYWVIGEFLVGVAVGWGGLFLLMQLQVWLGWLQWQNFEKIPDHLFSALGVGLGIGFVEELLFRGWLLTELERDYTPKRALWINSFFFTLVHFTNWEVIRSNWAQFPGLLLLGKNFVLARRTMGGRLGMAIGLHGGLVFGYYLIDVGDLLVSQEVVSPIVTGINNNPLAGFLGLIFLLGMGRVIVKLPQILLRSSQ